MIKTVIWQNGVIKPFKDATTHVMSHGLHYGTGVFEGIRGYVNQNGKISILCLEQHIERLFYSAQPIKMKIPYTKEQIHKAIIDTVKANNFKQSFYIRPLVYFGLPSSGIRVMPAENTPVECVICCYELGDYLPNQAIDVKISDYVRIHPESTAVDAKICGHYINSVQALLAIKNTHYGEVILLDYAGYVAEGSSENIFIIKNKVIHTPLNGTILKGITRNIIMELAKHLGYSVIESKIKPEDLFTADEAFFSGTAVEIRGIASVNDNKIGNGEEGEITKILKAEYKKICYGENPIFVHYLTKLEL